METGIAQAGPPPPATGWPAVRRRRR